MLGSISETIMTKQSNGVCCGLGLRFCSVSLVFSFLFPIPSLADSCPSKPITADDVRTELATLGMSESDVNEAVEWARSSCRTHQKETVFLPQLKPSFS